MRLKDHRKEAYAQCVASGMKKVDAALKAGYKPSYAKHTEKIETPEVSERIGEIIEERCYPAREEDKERIADRKELLETATEFLRNKACAPKDRMRALDLIARIHGVYDNKLTLEGGVKVNIVGGDTIRD